MRRRAPDPTSEPQPLPQVTTEHLKAAIDASVGPLKTELKWQRYVVGLLATVAFGPKLAVIPALSVILEPGFAQHMVGVCRAYLSL